MARLLSTTAAALSITTLAAIAQATVTEPDGAIVPKDSGSEVQVYTLFQQLGDPVQWQNDAHETPATFSPLCDFTATLLLHQAGSSLGVGWYNAPASSPPSLADIHVVVPAGTPVGATITGSQIKSDPAYAGGEVGFALVGNQTHYSEYQWNPTCSGGLPPLFGCSNPGPWKLAVIYKSVNTPNAYYVAFEDGTVSSTSFGNDGDFNDYVFKFTGLAGCSGAGEACDTGTPGVCGPGITQCSGSGAITCSPIQAPGAEACNGIDEDCDGVVDNDAPCPANEVCDHGTCVKKCGGGEFICPGVKVCNAGGYCVDPACQTVTCPDGQVCVAGTCKGACDGVVCPLPAVCRAGTCLDPCAGVSCGASEVCESGVCVPKCACRPCPTGKACDNGTGACLDALCANVTLNCGAGEICVAGACADACVGATCPAGEICTAGACVPGATDGGAGAGAGGAAGIGGGFLEGGLTGGAAGVGGLGGGAGAAGSKTDAGAPGKGFSSDGIAEPASPCGCRTPGSPVGTSRPIALALAALTLLRLRRRNR